MEEQKIVHRDLAARNVLLVSLFQVFLCFENCMFLK